ncbi:hypothetical protein H5410_029047 [Solanum commersonii]|uniref:ATP citrate synthase n=1 Tax=Solanum commersonii TaxID=4109 RepID=A0A9J5Z3L1_SOLCO|nr:hypothetical protein H5410_029047 [Solanum commersonii]
MATGQLFSKTTQALFYNYKQLPVQRMLDFDFLCRRETPSVAAIINPGSEGFKKLFFGQEEIAIPSRSDYVPESDTKQLIAYAKTNNKVIIGPATVGGIQAGAFKIGDTAGTTDNIIQCKLYRPGSVGFVSKYGGMSDELYNTIARVTDGIYEGIAIGGNVFPGSTLSDHVLRFNNIPQWEMNNGEMESAQAKNQALKDTGAVVPISYEVFEGVIKETFQKLVKEGKITPIKEVTPPQIPEDLSTAIKSGKVRVPTHIISTISDERGVEQRYAGVPMSTLVEQGYGVGDIICIMMCADHWSLCFGAHNSIVTARAGKDLISCLVSGLLTIGPRFCGAIDDAARYFKDAYDRGLPPSEFVEGMKIKGIRVPRIGHRVKRGDNRDKRVELLQRNARENFPSVEYMEYAVQVETYTLSKANNLILNIGGVIRSLFLDLLDGTGMFTKQEIVEIGYLNGLFVLARSIGLIGHTFDQKRMKQSLYRHPWEDVLYTK